jgi:hypothetical protein
VSVGRQPANAEGMARGVGIGLDPSRGRTIVGSFQQSTAQPDDLVVGGIEPFSADNVEVEVDLLRGAVRPLGLDVVWSQLDA